MIGSIMLTTIQNLPATLAVIVTASGAAVPISGVVTASVVSMDGGTVYIPPKAATLGTEPGAVSVDLTEAETLGIAAGDALLVVAWSRGVKRFAVTSTSLGQIERSALFIKDVAVDQLRADRLMLLANSIMPDLQVSDDYLWDKLRAAEAHVAHALRVPLAPTRFFPRTPTPEQIAALPAGMLWDVDPAYDYDPANYTGDKWGMILTRQKPIQSIVGMKFVYPSPQQTIIDVPMDWIRHDPRYGQVQIVPTGTAYQTLLGGMFLSQFSGGRQLPFTVELEYIAGLANAARDYPDMIDAIQKMAVVKIVEDGFMPQSGSISADGLSQSLSVDASKYQESVDTILNGPAGSNGGLMARIHGVRMTVI
jgi:hypothetical protein